MDFSPDVIAFTYATLSAQIVSEKDADSIFAPVYIFPDLDNKAVPTFSFE